VTAPKDDFFEAMFAEFSDLPEKEQASRATCAILAIHMASQSNLFAAVAWTIVNLLQYPEEGAIVENEIDELKRRFGSTEYTNNAQGMDEGLDHLEKCFHESIRLAQQSLTLRLVLKPVQVDGYMIVPGKFSFPASPCSYFPLGYYIATLLSCLNTDESLLPGASEFRPEEHYAKGGKVKSSIPGVDHSISTFGYLVHQCPGKKFAVTAANTLVVHLFEEFDLEPRFPEGGVTILSTQIGAVGRPSSPALVGYKRKTR
jgi:cytochrome P450